MDDNASLENSIRRASEEMIAEIREKEARELRRLEEDYAAEVERFRKKTQDETQARLDQELSRMENRAVLERKKIKLAALERFISRRVEDVMKGIRSHPRYRQFLVDAAAGAAADIPENVEVRIAPDDGVFGNDIDEALRSAGGDRRIRIEADASIGWGGCLVVDADGGRIFNCTLERIYFRKALQIRRKVLQMLQDKAGAVEGKESVTR
ncbi:MAG TPA: V-type ATP synthase subunit E [Smithellaceae bacterium]|nr:V-type ATP synthase subunit E [Smithellaceae bacterium]HRS82349.1 V-type ATP synthase subunit E [Smithellaceae bacterium]HRV43997.1 V-type ATP synthase subunit E [Smithellaceae bacterium]